VAFFKRSSTGPSDGAGLARMSEGRNLYSSLGLAECLATIQGTLDAVSPSPYRQMPSLMPANASWSGPEPAPSTYRYASYQPDDVFIFAFWPEGSGTTVGLYPLGAGAALQTPFIGQWKQRDGSLTSRGQFPGGTVGLGAPKLPAGYFEDLLQQGGAEVEAHNLDRAMAQVTMMFCLKASQFIGGQAGQRAADHFIDTHRWDGEPSTPQRTLDDLGAFSKGVLPYIADLPWRIRGLLLERDQEGRVSGTLWKECGVA
jgi:hypothetical protein